MKKYIVISLILLIILVIIGSLIFLVPTINCKIKGGSYEKAGLSRTFICVIPYEDAGQSCTSSSQCTGRCIYTGYSNGELNNDYLEFANNYKEGDKLQVNGYCEENSNPFGCSAEVINGFIEHLVLCVD